MSLPKKNLISLLSIFVFIFCSYTTVYSNTHFQKEPTGYVDFFKKKKKRYKANGYKRCKMAKQRDKQVYRIMKKARRQAKR